MKTLLTAVLVAFATVSPALAGTSTTRTAGTVTDLGGGNYSFQVGGWSGGGTLTGTFSGVVGTNTQIGYFTGNLTDFSASWSGDANTDPFTVSFADIGVSANFVWTIGNFTEFGNSLDVYAEGFGAEGPGYSIYFGIGPEDDCGQNYDCGVVTTGPVSTPAPGMAALFGLSFLGLGARRFRVSSAR